MGDVITFAKIVLKSNIIVEGEEYLITLTFVAKPWWKRFIVGVELFIFGSIIVEWDLSKDRKQIG